VPVGTAPKKHRPHALLEFPQHFGRLMGWMKNIALFTDMGTASIKDVKGELQNLRD
jgi:hypothetical protein